MCCYFCQRCAGKETRPQTACGRCFVREDLKINKAYLSYQKLFTPHKATKAASHYFWIKITMHQKMLAILWAIWSSI